MARIPLITDRGASLTPEQEETFDWVVASRGKMIRPFQVLLHTPVIARHAAELGAQIRFGSSLSDHDRELVIVTAAKVHDCTFEWESHRPLAEAAGVRPEVLDYLDVDYLDGDHLDGGTDVELADHESLLIDFVRELCRSSTVSDGLFTAARERLGVQGTVELCATVGYYTMLGYVMGACDAC